MKIVLLTEVFAKNMGYLENMLPKYLARLGAEVHVVASSLPPDHRNDGRQEIYRGLAAGGGAGRTESVNGFHLDVVEHGWKLGHLRLLGLGSELERLRPDIVQTVKPIGWIAMDAARHQPGLGYRLFSGCHYHASVFPLAQKPLPLISARRLRCLAERGLQGRVLSWFTEKYYAISEDCASVAARFFGVPGKKIEIAPLGVDTEIFYPAATTEDAEARRLVRRRLGFSDDEIVCVYSGRLTEDKNPLLLARAIHELRVVGAPFRGLFLGSGPQAETIAARSGCVVHPFVPVSELGDWYRAAEIGVWPAQESLSMLDASACGLPIIANDRMGAPERLESCGLAYRLGDVRDLKDKIGMLVGEGLRRKLGWSGARRVKETSSWKVLAAHRLADYEAAVARSGERRTAGRGAGRETDQSSARHERPRADDPTFTGS